DGQLGLPLVVRLDVAEVAGVVLAALPVTVALVRKGEVRAGAGGIGRAAVALLVHVQAMRRPRVQPADRQGDAHVVLALGLEARRAGDLRSLRGLGPGDGVASLVVDRGKAGRAGQRNRDREADTARLWRRADGSALEADCHGRILRVKARDGNMHAQSRGIWP